ncbi:hypothetical protein HOC01_04955 [archaeon]|nr:hypothetical protein [archaeon]MBT6698317.1 hypothetical protein [archaeon]
MGNRKDVRLENVPGLGERSVSKIVGLVGDDQIDLFLESLSLCKFRWLFSLDLDSRIMNEIVKHCYSLKYGFSYASGLVQSSVISKIQSDLLGAIRRNFVLESNNRKLIGFSPTADLKEIGRRQQIVETSVAFFNRFDMRKVKEMRSLLKVSGRKVNFDSEVLILCDEAAIFENLRELVPKEIMLVKIDSLNELEGYVEEELIRYVYSDESKFVSDVEMSENVEAIKWKTLFDVAPELLLYKFRSEQVYLEAALVLIEDYGVEFTSGVDREVLSSLIESLEEENQEKKGLREEDLQNFCVIAEGLVEDKLGSMQISGKELLGLLRSDVKDHALLSKVISDVKQELSILENGYGKEKLRYLDFSSALPEVDSEKILVLAREQAMNAKRREFLSCTDFAVRFSEKIWLIDACKDFLEQVDFLLGLGETFSDAKKPKIASSGRFSCLDLKSTLMLSKGVDVCQISYYLDRAQTIITGANSGGKTSILHLIAESQLLTMMGLFVQGEVEVPLYEEIHFFKKSNGTVGSGAFETTLKNFASIAVRKSNCLILIDEIESITEPGAAGRLIAGTLEWLSGQAGKDVVLVSHLGDVLSELCPQARIDGIEAVALSDTLELVVERNPKIGMIAKSTPQLIVEKLARLEDAAGADSSERYFEFLLAKMSG